MLFALGRVESTLFQSNFHSVIAIAHLKNCPNHICSLKTSANSGYLRQAGMPISAFALRIALVPV